MFEFFLKGGPLMWPILLCSIVSLCIILERFYFFYKTRERIPNFATQIKNLLKQKRIDESIRLCETAKGIISHILGIAVHMRMKSQEAKDRILKKYVSKMLRKLERNLNILAVIGNIAPLLGLLGTITGMIRAFMRIHQLKGSAGVSDIAGGIWEALITTAFGLLVAIPTIAFYHYFEIKVNNILNETKESVSDILEDENSILDKSNGN